MARDSTTAERRAAKARLIAGLRRGQPWDEAARAAHLRVGRATAYRWRQRAQVDETLSVDDGRHGHASKVRGSIRAWLAASCRDAPETPGHRLQTALRDRFGLDVSVSQINRIRAVLGLSRRRRAGGGPRDHAGA